MAEEKVKVKKVAEKKPVKAVKEPKSVEVKEKVVAKVAVKAEASIVTKKESSLTIDVYGVDGKVSGKISLPEAIFGEEINKKLLAQAVRVYLANQRQGNASTKTRGEVDGSTRKIYRQKGTGRARHGSVRAPIFVKGGIVFGPKPRDFGLTLPKKMKKKALFSALSAKLLDGEVKVVSGLGALEPKTKIFVAAMKSLGLVEKKTKVLLVTAEASENLKRAVRNAEGVKFTDVKRLNAYDVLNNKQLVLPKEAIAEIESHFLVKE